MADITNTSPVVTEDKLKDFYEDIKPFLGCPAYVTQEGSSDYYSTDEKIIGRWIDGKPLYQKTFVPSTTYNAGTHNIATGITNIDKMVEIKGVQINNNTGDTFAIDENSNDYIGYIGGKIVYTKTSTGVTWKIIVSIKYTKTTDSAQTATITDPNEYSTEEKIVGKWIDGKPIYQKTITGTIDRNKTILNITNMNIIGISQFRAAYSRGYVFDSRTVNDLDFYTEDDTFLIINDNGSEFINREFIITIQYTKSTD